MQNRPSADALMMRAGYAVTGRPIGLWIGEGGVGARAVRGHSPVVPRRGGLPWPSWPSVANTPEATVPAISERMRCVSGNMVVVRLRYGGRRYPKTKNTK